MKSSICGDVGVLKTKRKSFRAGSLEAHDAARPRARGSSDARACARWHDRKRTRSVAWLRCLLRKVYRRRTCLWRPRGSAAVVRSGEASSGRAPSRSASPWRPARPSTRAPISSSPTRPSMRTTSTATSSPSTSSRRGAGRASRSAIPKRLPLQLVGGQRHGAHPSHRGRLRRRRSPRRSHDADGQPGAERFQAVALEMSRDYLTRAALRAPEHGQQPPARSLSAAIRR